MNELLFLSLNKVNAIFKKCTVGNIQLVGHDFFFPSGTQVSPLGDVGREGWQSREQTGRRAGFNCAHGKREGVSVDLSTPLNAKCFLEI